MKKTCALLAAVLVLAGSCKKEAASTAGLAMDKDTSYSMGMYLASQLSLPDVTYDYNAFKEGFQAYTEGQETRLTMDEAYTKIGDFFDLLYAQEDEVTQAEAAANLAEGQAFLAENGARPGVTTTASGLQYEVEVEGTGRKPGATDTVRVNYEGTLLDGTVFDSSYERGEPIEFPLDMVISGWTEGSSS